MRSEVEAKTGGKQQPWYAASISGSFSFNSTGSSNNDHSQPATNNNACIINDAFHKAAARGNLAFVTNCLRRGVDVNRKEQNGWTALHSAARNGKNEIIVELIKNGANVNSVDNTGRTPLDQAYYGKQYHTTKLIERYNGVRYK